MLAASWLPHFVYKITGRMPFVVKDLHDRYGPVVRTGPGELAFISGQAWRDIYGQQPGLPQNRRDPYSYTDPNADQLMPHNILMANDRDHARQRSQLAHAFSTRALHGQQPLISGHIDRFIDQLRIRAGQEPQDMNAWFIWVTFDIIGDLAFGKPFGCLETASYHPWILTVYQSARVGTVMANLRRFGVNLNKFFPRAFLKPRLDMLAFCRERVKERLELGEAAERSDFVTCMLTGTQKGDPAMTSKELQANAEIMTIAGSETTATLLVGMTFLLLTQRPDWLAKLAGSIRTTFRSDGIDEMNFQTVTARLPLLVATISEALRFYPPVPSSHSRLIEMHDRTVDGETIPVGTAVTVYQWAANHSAQNWYKPEEFLPERWLDVGEKDSHSKLVQGIANDHRDAMNAFSLGSRGCLGRK